MAIVIADRVKVTTTTTGTGTLTLGSAVTGFQDFGAIGDGNETYYTISVPGGADWEVGIGTYTASGTTLSRDTILASSNGGSAVNLSAGTKDVFVTYPSERSVVSYDGNNSEFSTGTRMIFGQTTAPTGWTKDTLNYDQHALRVVTGTASTGGTVDFTTAFASQTPTGNVSVTANTGDVAQGGNISASTGAVTQGGNISVSTGNATVPVSIGNTTATGNVSVSTGNAASPNGNTTLAVPTIPAHAHALVEPGSPHGWPRFFNTFTKPSTAGITGYNAPSATRNNGTGNTGGSGAHTHPAGNHTHPASGSFSGVAHTHPASGGAHAHPASGSFTGSPHSHPVSATFTGSNHSHPVSAPATFSGSAINLAVKYLDVITATKD
jgi:hypothetical protein